MRNRGKNYQPTGKLTRVRTYKTTRQARTTRQLQAEQRFPRTRACTVDSQPKITQVRHMKCAIFLHVSMPSYMQAVMPVTTQSKQSKPAFQRHDHANPGTPLRAAKVPATHPESPAKPAGPPQPPAIPKSASTGNMPAGKQQCPAHKVHQRRPPPLPPRDRHTKPKHQPIAA